MNAAVGLMDGLGLDGDRGIRVIPRQEREKVTIRSFDARPLFVATAKTRKMVSNL